MIAPGAIAAISDHQQAARTGKPHDGRLQAGEAGAGVARRRLADEAHEIGQTGAESDEQQDE